MAACWVETRLLKDIVVIGRASAMATSAAAAMHTRIMMRNVLDCYYFCRVLASEDMVFYNDEYFL